MCTGEDKQLEAFARFVKLAGLRPNLERKDWTGFCQKDIMVPDMLRITTIKLEEAYRRFTK